MTVKVLLFASARDKMGCAELALEVSEGLCVRDLLALPEMARLDVERDRLRFAVNEEFVELQARVKDGDLLAVIPPVCGG
jgi:molybdopterin synthase sulfur carrier subunit